jgi:lipoprotein NlpI
LTGYNDTQVVAAGVAVMLRHLVAALAAGAALEANPAQSGPPDIRALYAEATAAIDRGESEKAVAALDQVIAADSKQADAFYLRGRERFKLGKVAESIADFDALVRLRPEKEHELWERGISHYYAGKFKDGAKQFELYQTYHDNDVENSVWRFLCVARADGVDKAKKNMLPIKDDRRVPMMEIYGLFRDAKKPDEVLAAAEAGDASDGERNSLRFYAHLYLGLYYEAHGDAKLARQHIRTAAEKHRIGHSMWNGADVHAKRLGK